MEAQRGTLKKTDTLSLHSRSTSMIQGAIARQLDATPASFDLRCLTIANVTAQVVVAEKGVTVNEDTATVAHRPVPLPVLTARRFTWWKCKIDRRRYRSHGKCFVGCRSSETYIRRCVFIAAFCFLLRCQLAKAFAEEGEASKFPSFESFFPAKKWYVSKVAPHFMEKRARYASPG